MESRPLTLLMERDILDLEDLNDGSFMFESRECFRKLCTGLGVSVAKGTISVGELSDGQLDALSNATGYKVAFVVNVLDKMSHVELVSDDASAYYVEYGIASSRFGIRSHGIFTIERFFSVHSPVAQCPFYASDSKAVGAMEKYHEYLTNNYVGGVDRFFSPTGYLADFEAKVKLESAKAQMSVLARDVDDAANKLMPIVQESEGVFDLAAEPGSGKTSVLPFRFGSKKVTVALPTPFDAFSAYMMATKDCTLRLQGLILGNQRSPVVYTDSYFAASNLASGQLDCDILIVDECDSGKGVTPFLAGVKRKNMVVIRMSASHGVTRSGPSKSFAVTERTDMPRVDANEKEFASYVTSNASGRSLVLLPDAQSAAEVQRLIPNSKLVSSASSLGDMARVMCDQKADITVVADDVCARGLNLNLDSVFDSQLVTVHGVTRHATEAELYQRKFRVGRNKPGWYYSPGLSPAVLYGNSDLDVLRNNVARALSDIKQEGGSHLQLSKSEAENLKCSHVEPYVICAKIKAASAVTPPEDRQSPPAELEAHRRSASDEISIRSTSSSIVRKVQAPSWAYYFSGGMETASMPTKYVVTRDSGQKAMARKSFSSTGSGAKSSNKGYVRDWSFSESLALATRAQLPVAQAAPYSSSGLAHSPVAQRRVEIPDTPPVMNLTELTYDMNWPSLIRDRFYSGQSLPTILPPAGWRHTSSGGFRIDWVRKLEDLSLVSWGFDDNELETVCRAWNILVSRRWVKGTSGLNPASLDAQLEFCTRYFQAHYMHTMSS